MAEAHLEKVGRGWKRIKPYLLGPMVVLVVAGAILALIHVPKMQVPVCPPDQTGLSPKICFDIENEARKTLAYIMGGILAIIGIYMAHRRIRGLERQVLVAQEGQITERFTRAIEQLGSERMEVRLGGIYALERIANDSDKDYWPIMETLTAYVRERTPWQERPVESTLPGLGKEPSTDIRAVLNVLGRRKYRMGQGENLPLNLSNTDLRGAPLQGHFEYASFMNAHLEGASFVGVQIKGAFFWDTYLQGANFIEACLEEADFLGAHLEGVIFWDAHIERANFKEAKGLTHEQLARAIMDEQTNLPDYLKEQPPEVKGPEGSR
jgi:hypothetical protein